jgi:hypothetical protein
VNRFLLERNHYMISAERLGSIILLCETHVQKWAWRLTYIHTRQHNLNPVHWARTEWMENTGNFVRISYRKHINLLAMDFFFQILAHPVFKMWVIQKPNKVALWNKRHFEEKKNWDYTACLKYSVRIFVE